MYILKDKINNLNSHLQNLEKDGQNKCQPNKRKKIKITARTSEIKKQNSLKSKKYYNSPNKKLPQWLNKY
jgi:ribosomal protein S15P/S13E